MESKFESQDTLVENVEVTLLLEGKTVERVTKVSCDEGAVIHFTDGTKLEFGYSGCEGQTAINNQLINVSGL